MEDKEENQAMRDEFAEFLKTNISSLDKIPDERNVKLSVFDFSRLHGLFMGVEIAIMLAVDGLLEENHSKRMDILRQFQKVIIASKKERDSFFIDILKNNLGGDHET